MSALLSALRAARAALLAFDPAEHDGRECAALVAELASAEKACAAAKARTAARAAACGAHRELGHRDAHEWLARESGITSTAARAQLDTALLMVGCPSTAAAAAAGELSLDQAREIVKEVLEEPASEDELVAFARSHPLHALRDEVRRRRLERMDPDDLHRRQRRNRSLRHRRDDEGMVRFAGALPPEHGVPFVNRLDAETDRVWRAAKRAGQEPEGRGAYAADAFVRMLEGGGKGRHRAADIVVVVDSRKLVDGDDAEGPCHIIGGGPVPVSVVRAMARDAFLKVVLHDGVEVQRIAHVGRYQPEVLRTALLIGPPPTFDGVVCDEDGCDRRYGLEWDHVDPVANGGLTTLRNEKPKCGPHHTEKTERDRAAGLLRGRKRGP